NDDTAHASGYNAERASLQRPTIAVLQRLTEGQHLGERAFLYAHLIRLVSADRHVGSRLLAGANIDTAVPGPTIWAPAPLNRNTTGLRIFQCLPPALPRASIRLPSSRNADFFVPGAKCCRAPSRLISIRRLIINVPPVAHDDRISVWPFNFFLTNILPSSLQNSRFSKCRNIIRQVFLAFWRWYSWNKSKQLPDI